MECRTVGSFMTSPPIALNLDDSLFRTVEVLHEKGISVTPVVDDSGYLVGILSESDLFRALRVHKEVYRSEALLLMIPLG